MLDIRGLNMNSRATGSVRTGSKSLELRSDQSYWPPDCTTHKPLAMFTLHHSMVFAASSLEPQWILLKLVRLLSDKVARCIA